MAQRPSNSQPSDCRNSNCPQTAFNNLSPELTWKWSCGSAVQTGVCIRMVCTYLDIGIDEAVEIDIDVERDKEYL